MERKKPPPERSNQRRSCRGAPPPRPPDPTSVPKDPELTSRFSHGKPAIPLPSPTDSQTANSAPARVKEERAMRNPQRRVIYPSVIVLLALLGSTIVAPQDPGSGLVDFRMAPLEQAKKISTELRQRFGAGESVTLMIPPAGGDMGRHLILSKPPPVSTGSGSQLAGDAFDGISWHRPAEPRPFGACDSQEECTNETDELCEGAGHGGVDEATVAVTTHADGSRTCSGDCSEGGAVALITCGS